MKTLIQSNPIFRPSRGVMLAALLGALGLAWPDTASAGQSAPGIYHGWIMRGQVLSVEDGKGIVCIGKRDQARVGDVLTVVRQTPVTTGGPRASGFRPVEVGQVRLAVIVDDHYSEYEVVKGRPQVHDTVELERR